MLGKLLPVQNRKHIELVASRRRIQPRRIREIQNRIAAAAENTGAALLVSASALEDLKGKFSAEKNYKIRLKSGQEIAVHQVKV